jgi:hypothetical protein
MSRRHSSSRRRNYGRRQHEVRERRSPRAGGDDFEGRAGIEDWQLADLEDERPPRGASDGYGAMQP